MVWVLVVGFLLQYGPHRVVCKGDVQGYTGDIWAKEGRYSGLKGIYTLAQVHMERAKTALYRLRAFYSWATWGFMLVGGKVGDACGYVWVWYEGMFITAFKELHPLLWDSP